MLNKTTTICPCGSGQTFENCCGKYISYSQYPDSPEQLMRSRYSAYVLKNEDYLLKTWHQSTRPDFLELENDTSQWKKLKIISVVDNKVQFIAYFVTIINGKEHLFSLYEESLFIKENHWFYLEGNDLKTIELTKNMPCPCRSGKKFKRCCETEI